MCGCGNNIEPERVSLGFINCSSCAHRGADTPRVKGRMVYGHKTAGEIEIMTAETFNSNKEYLLMRRVSSLLKRSFISTLCSANSAIMLMQKNNIPSPIIVRAQLASS